MTPGSAIQFLLWLLIVASAIAVISNRLRIPYTVALVMGGLVLGSVRDLPIIDSLAGGQRPNWLTPDVILILFLPPLLFEGSIKVRIRYLRENLVPILLLANVGVLVATLITGLAVHWAFGLPIMIALLFGSIISATDPISVLAVFHQMGVGKRLSMIVEGESLFNDGTAVVLFGILLAGISSGHLGVVNGVARFVIVVAGSAALGALLGYLISKITQRIDEPTIEITLTAVLAYGSYMTAQSLHLSGVMATVAAGIVLGHFGAGTGMGPRTQLAMWSFWEYAAFVINSLLFLLIGMQVRVAELLRGWHAALLAIGAVLLGRVLSVYGLTPLSNVFSQRIPMRWQHVLVWGGLRGALALTLALSLEPRFPYRAELLTWTFGVVAFSLIVQGLTIKPLLRLLGMTARSESDYERTKARQMALSAARRELDDLLKSHLVSAPLYSELRHALEADLEQADAEIAAMYTQDSARAQREISTARARLLAAGRGAIERALHDGLISRATAGEMFGDSERYVADLAERLTNGSDPNAKADSEPSTPHPEHQSRANE